MRAASAAVLALALLAFAPAVRTEAARGFLGITLSIAGEGVFIPTIREVVVAKVHPGGPAAQAGITAGDKVLEVDGKRIPGASSVELAPLAKGKRPGETVAVLLQRPDGTVVRAAVVAGVMPK